MNETTKTTCTECQGTGLVERDDYEGGMHFWAKTQCQACHGTGSIAEQLTTDEQEALTALRTRSDWQGGYGQPQLMCLGYLRYGWTLNEVRAEHYEEQYEAKNAQAYDMTLAQYQAAAIVEALGF